MNPFHDEDGDDDSLNRVDVEDNLNGDVDADGEYSNFFN